MKLGMEDYRERFRDTKTCIVTFSTSDGWHIPLVPHFEFEGILSDLGVSYVLMHDSSDNWYSKGVPGLGDQRATAIYINHLKRRYPRVITVGVSYGSYGSLLYGQLAHTHESVAISPVTTIGAPALEVFEPRWHHRIMSKLDLDLRPYFVGGPIPRTRAFITDGDGAELDWTMANILGIKDIEMIPGHTHGSLAKHMRDTGWYDKLFKEMAG